jgi:hypothetical protein
MKKVGKSDSTSAIAPVGGGGTSLPDALWSSVDRQLCALLDFLVAIRIDLATGTMPRAARMTGTSDRLDVTVAQLDTAILATKEIIAQLEVRNLSPNEPLRIPKARPDETVSGA